MAVVYHEIYLPIDTESTFDYIVIKQGDAGTHKVRATLISNNRVYTIPTSGASYFMKFRKPDNNYCLVEATVSDNTISAEVTEEMLRVSGTGRGEFMIVSGSNELKTATFHVKIVKETYTSEDVQSHSDFAPFAALLQGAGAAASNANTAAAAANAAASLAEQKAQAIPDDYSDLVAEVEEVNESLGDFKATGGADKYISNVKVYGTPVNMAIGNIRNNYSGQTGFAIFPATSDTEWGSAIKNVTNASVSGHFCEELSDGRTYEFDYDLSGLTSGTRDTTRDAAHVIKTSRFYDVATPGDIETVSDELEDVSEAVQDIQCDFVEFGGASPYFSNVKVHGPVGYTIITNLRNNFVTSDGSVQSGFVIYASNSSGTDSTTQLKSVNDSVSGHFYQKLSDGRTYEFDYDLSAIPTGTRITATGLAHLISPKCFDSMVDNNLHLGIGFFDAFGVIGDSYASGEIYVPDGNGGYTARDLYNASWGQIIARKYGNTCTNFSKGGLTTRSWLADPMGLALLQSSDPQPLYLCALGANDISKLGVNYLGTSADIHTDDPTQNADTFYGNYGKIISAILAKSPNAKIILFTVAYQYSSVEAQFNAAIRSIASVFGVRAIVVSADLYYAEDSVYNTKRVQNHPTAALYSGMAEANIRLIDRCVYENMDYFADYVPIGE